MMLSGQQNDDLRKDRNKLRSETHVTHCKWLCLHLKNADLMGGSLAVDVVQNDVLRARQRGGGVHGRRHIEQSQLQVGRWRGRLLRIVFCRRQRLVVATDTMQMCLGSCVATNQKRYSLRTVS